MTSAKSNRTDSRLIANMQNLFPDRNVEIHHLKHPTKEFVVDWYIHFLTSFNLNCDALFQMSARQRDLYGETLPLAKLSKILSNIFQSIYFDDAPPFGIMDLLNPTPGRTVMFFTGMTNFLSYCVSKYREIEAFLSELDAKKAHWDELLQKRENLLASLNEQANITAHLSDLEEKINKKRDDLRALADEVTVVGKQMAEKDDIKAKLEAKLEQFNVDLAQATEEMDSVKIQVIKSPQTVKLQQTQLKKKLEDVEEKVVSAQNMLTNKRELVKRLENITEELQLRQAAVEKIVNEWKSISDGKASIAELRKTSSRLAEEISRDISERQNLCVKGKELLETLSGLHLCRDNKRQDFQARLTTLKNESKNIKKQNLDEVRRLQNEEKNLSIEISSLMRTNETLNKHYGDLYASLLAGERRFGENVVREVEEAVLKLERPKI